MWISTLSNSLRLGRPVAMERQTSCQTADSQLSVETLEERCLLSSVAYGDFNNDGRMDMAEITSPTAITVSLVNADGSYTVSATLRAPNSLPVVSITLGDFNSDGKLDISAGGLANNRFYSHIWLGNGDGSFGDRLTQKGGRIRPGW